MPYFYEAASQFDSELSSTYGIEINTNLTIKPETAAVLLTAENPGSLTLDFFTVYEDEPNSLGWYLQDRLEAEGAVLKNDGTLEHGTCIGGDNRVGDCSTTVFNLTTIKNASCLLYTSPSPRDQRGSRMPSSA